MKEMGLNLRIDKTKSEVTVKRPRGEVNSWKLIYFDHHYMVLLDCFYEFFIPLLKSNVKTIKKREVRYLTNYSPVLPTRWGSLCQYCFSVVLLLWC